MKCTTKQDRISEEIEFRTKPIVFERRCLHVHHAIISSERGSVGSDLRKLLNKLLVPLISGKGSTPFNKKIRPLTGKFREQILRTTAAKGKKRKGRVKDNYMRRP